LTDQFAHIVWILMALVLVGSSLALRRLPKGRLLSMILIWVGIFALVWLGVHYYTACCAPPSR